VYPRTDECRQAHENQQEPEVPEETNPCCEVPCRHRNEDAARDSGDDRAQAAGGSPARDQSGEEPAAGRAAKNEDAHDQNREDRAAQRHEREESPGDRREEDGGIGAGQEKEGSSQAPRATVGLRSRSLRNTAQSGFGLPPVLQAIKAKTAATRESTAAASAPYPASIPPVVCKELICWVEVPREV
jgi:hypothetical protein